MDVFNGKKVIYNNDRHYWHRVCRTHKISKGLDYNQETGVLTYKSTGDLVDKIDNRGELVVGGYFLEKHYYCKAKDVIWMIMTGGLPIRGVVQAKDGDETNMRWNNIVATDRDTADRFLD